MHVEAGTANAVMGLHNCTRSRVPLLLMAGKAPFAVRGELSNSRYTTINFLQEPPGHGRPGAALRQVVL